MKRRDYTAATHTIRSYETAELHRPPAGTICRRVAV